MKDKILYAGAMAFLLGMSFVGTLQAQPSSMQHPSTGSSMPPPPPPPSQYGNSGTYDSGMQDATSTPPGPAANGGFTSDGTFPDSEGQVNPLDALPPTPDANSNMMPPPPPPPPPQGMPGGSNMGYPDSSLPSDSNMMGPGGGPGGTQGQMPPPGTPGGRMAPQVGPGGMTNGAGPRGGQGAKKQTTSPNKTSAKKKLQKQEVARKR